MDPAASDTSDLPAMAALAPAPPKACGNCAKVKCKCVYREDGQGCERCVRLKKSCTPSTLVRRHKTARRVESNRTTNLEEKFDDLLLVLRERGISSIPSPDSTTAVAAKNDAANNDGSDEFDSEADQDPGSSRPGGYGPPTVIPTPGSSVNDCGQSNSGPVAEPPVAPPAWQPEEPSNLEAEESLSRFREEKLPFFPFVHILPNTPASQIRATHPFLFLNIMSIAAISPTRRVALGGQVHDAITQRIIVGREKSMDLLLGLVAYLAWAHLQRDEKVNINLYSSLIVLMIYELGLHKPPAELNFRTAPCHGANPTVMKERTNEDRRVVLAAFLLTSMTSLAINGGPGLAWSIHIDGYLTHLAQRSSLEQDRILVALVRMQLVIEQVQLRMNPGGNSEMAEMALANLRTQMESLTKADKNGPPPSNVAVCQHFHFAALVIEEAYSPSTQQQQQQQYHYHHMPAPVADKPAWRLESYQRQLYAVKSWLDIFLASSCQLKRCMPIYSFSQAVISMMALHRLTTLDDPVWDRAAVRQTVDLLPTLDLVIATFEGLRTVTTLLPPDLAEDEAFMWAVVVFQNMKNNWEDDVPPLDDVVGGDATAVAAAAAVGGFIDGGMHQAISENGDDGGMLHLQNQGFYNTWMHDQYQFGYQ